MFDTAPRHAPLRLSGIGSGWGRVLPLMGPAFVACVAYVDPGNFATNFSAGRFGYALLWVVVVANVIAMVIQMLAAKLGAVTGLDLAGNCREHLPRPVVWGLWVQAEAVAVATDLAEVVGGAVALYLLFGLPPFVGGVITAGVAFGVLSLHGRRHRQFEVVILGLLGVVGVGFLYTLLVSGADVGSAAAGLVPGFQGSGSLVLATGILGATVMPHAIYAHSALTAGVATSGGAGAAPGAAPGVAGLWRVLRTQRAEVVLAMGVAGCVNVMMLVVAAELMSRGGPRGLDDLVGAHARLASTFGGAAALAFATALLASGLAASSVGTYAGQVVMDGFLRRKVPLPVRRLLTLVPALAVLGLGVNATSALVWSQVVLSFGIPFALLPLVVLTARRGLMGPFVNHPLTTVTAAVAATVVIALNGALVVGLLLG